MLSGIINFILETVGAWGYGGIFIMMFLESSFFISKNSFYNLRIFFV